MARPARTPTMQAPTATRTGAGLPIADRDTFDSAELGAAAGSTVGPAIRATTNASPITTLSATAIAASGAATPSRRLRRLTSGSVVGPPVVPGGVAPKTEAGAATVAAMTTSHARRVAPRINRAAS